MSQSLGYKYARQMRKFFSVNDGEKLEIADFVMLVEGGARGAFKVADEVGVLDATELPNLVRKHFIEKVEAGEDFFSIPFLLPVDILERLGAWTPWQTLRHYLKDRDVEPMLIFKNTRLLRDGLEVVPAEIRMVPIVEILA